MDVPCHYTFEIFVSNLSNVLGFTFSPSIVIFIFCFGFAVTTQAFGK